jgi:hypothetical protein
MSSPETRPSIPWFGTRKLVEQLNNEVEQLRKDRDRLAALNERFGGLSMFEIEDIRAKALAEAAAQRERLEQDRSRHMGEVGGERARLAVERTEHLAEIRRLKAEAESLESRLVETRELELLQEAGIYEYQHPLADAVSYQKELLRIGDEIKAMTKRDGGAVLATTDWLVNGSVVEGRAMVRDFSKLMLRAFNAEADGLVRSLRPHRLQASIDRLDKVAQVIERLGKSMRIRISTPYHNLRDIELRLTADFLHKQAAEKEAERLERERLREERKVQQEIERERARLEKERQHYENALAALVVKGDDVGADRLRQELATVQEAINDVELRAANIRAGYVYVISNIGSFGERMVKVGLTRRLDPLDRIRELSDASVPFNFDVHALFFSADAVGIESALHARLASVRVNTVNRRREFFRVTPLEIKTHLSELAGELLEFRETPEALEYRQCCGLQPPS